MSEDRATVIVRDLVEVLVRGIVEAIAVDLRCRVLSKEGLVSPELMQALVELVRDELKGVGEWETLGEAAARVVDRIDPSKGLPMRFEAMPRVYDDQPMWGARNGRFTFIITQDEPNGFSASVKVLNATPFDSSRHDLGGYCTHKSFTAAEQACRKFIRENRYTN